MTPPVLATSIPDSSLPRQPQPSGGPAPRPAPSHEHGLLSSIQSLLSVIVIAIFIITFCVQPFRIPSESMESTLLVGDFLLVDKQSVAPDGAGALLPSAAIRRGDIVVFHDPVNSSLHLVKRVIGLPGDRLRLHNQRVYINGAALDEPYAVYRPGPPDSFRDNFPRLQSSDPDIDSGWWMTMRHLIQDGELLIPPGSYFVLGDNRNDSEDSRYWGFVPRTAIIGKPLVIYFSLDQHTGSDTATLTQTAVPANPSQRPASRLDALVDFARWGRTLQIVR